MQDIKISEKERYKIANKVTWITIIINILLAILKVSVGILFNSRAMLADGVHTISDVASSVGIIISFFISKKPEDEKHHYGHEKAETIAGFILSILLFGVGMKIGYSTIKSIFTSTIEVPGVLAAWVAILSIIVKEIQYRIAMYGGNKINSSALKADAWHHRSDALSSIAAFIGIIGSRLGFVFLDPIAGLIVSIIVIKVGIEIFIQGFNELMDVSIEEEYLYEIAREIITVKEIKNINDLKVRKHGSKTFVDINICINSDIPICKGHDISDEVEEILKQKISNIKKVMVHIDPCYDKEVDRCNSCSNGVSRFLA